MITIIHLQVLHGCRRFVSWDVWLIPLTNAIPIVNLYLTLAYPKKGKLFGAMTSRYDPYAVGW